jgi:hypothetical protein
MPQPTTLPRAPKCHNSTPNSTWCSIWENKTSSFFILYLSFYFISIYLLHFADFIFVSILVTSALLSIVLFDFVACFSYFEKKNGSQFMRSAKLFVCLWILPPLFKFWIPEPIFMKLGTCAIWTAYFTNPSHQSVCLYVYPPIVARQRLGKHVPAELRIVWHVVLYGVRVVTKEKQAIISSQNVFLFNCGLFI